MELPGSVKRDLIVSKETYVWSYLEARELRANLVLKSYLDRMQVHIFNPRPISVVYGDEALLGPVDHGTLVPTRRRLLHLLFWPPHLALWICMLRTVHHCLPTVFPPMPLDQALLVGACQMVVDGVAMGEAGRACYRCSIPFAHLAHLLAGLTDLRTEQLHVNI